jgi:tyrosyl-tRNA synthetase
MPLDEIGRLERLQGAELNEAKKVLANEATALAHGRAAAEHAAATAKRVFEEGGIGGALPTVSLALGAGAPLIDALLAASLVESRSDARRQIRAGAVRVNDQPVADEMRKLSAADLNAEGVVKLSLGRKRHALVRPS